MRGLKINPLFLFNAKDDKEQMLKSIEWQVEKWNFSSKTINNILLAKIVM